MLDYLRTQIPSSLKALLKNLPKKHFSLAAFIQRLEVVLNREFGLDYSGHEIRKKLRTIGRKRDYSASTIARIFNLPNVGSVASIVSLFLKGS